MNDPYHALLVIGEAHAQMKIAEGIAEGKVQTVVIPYDFKGMVNVGAR